MKKMEKEIAWSYKMRGIPVSDQPGQIVTDPNGSYSGRPKDPEERPVQDADDL